MKTSILPMVLAPALAAPVVMSWALVSQGVAEEAKPGGERFQLRHDWPAGKEYRVHCLWESDISTTTGKNGAKLGGRVGHMVSNEYTLDVWPVPEGGKMFGLQWTGCVAETRSPGKTIYFDSRKGEQPGAKGANWGWDLVGKSWSYFDERGHFTGKTGIGTGQGPPHASPYSSLSPDADGSLFYRICALDSLPDEPVPTGHRWSADVRGDQHSFGSADAKVEFEFLRHESQEGRACAVIGFRATLTQAPPDPAKGAAPEEPDKKTVIDEAKIDGDIWLESSSGLPVKASARTSYIARIEGSPVRIKTADTMEMTLMSSTPIDPAAPRPPPLRDRAQAAVVPAAPAMPEGGKAPAVTPSGTPARPDAVSLQVILKPGTRTLLTNSVQTEIGIEMAGTKQEKIRIAMTDEVEEIIRAGDKAGELQHERRCLARIANAPGQGMSFDSRKWEAGEGKGDPSLVEDWKFVRSATFFLLRGADGKPVRSWAEGPNLKRTPPPTPLAARNIENYLEAKVFSPELLPKEPVSPGATWPLVTTLDSVGMADEVAVKGEFTLKSVSLVEGKRLAVVEFSGVLAPAEASARPKPGTGVIEKGQVEGSFTIDLEDASWRHRRIHNSYTARLETPGLKSKVRQQMDIEIEQAFLSREPLPPDP